MASPSPVARLEWLARVACDPAIQKAGVAVAGILATFPTAPGGDIFPSHETIAERAGICARSVRNAVKRLQKQGYIEVTPGGGRANTNIYRIVETRKENSGFNGKETRKEVSGFEKETRQNRVVNPANQGTESRKELADNPGSIPDISPDDRPGVTIEKWEGRIGSYGKSRDERIAWLSAIKEYGGTDSDIASAIAMIPSAPDDKSVARSLIESAILPLINRLREAREIEGNKKRKAALEAERKAREQAEKAKQETEAKRKAEEAAKPENVFFQNAFSAGIWRAAPDRFFGQRELNDLVMRAKGAIAAGAIPLDLGLKAVETASALPSVEDRIPVFSQLQAEHAYA